MLGSATIALFLSSALEGPSQTDSNSRMHALTSLNLYALVIFATDMWIRHQFQRQDLPPNKHIYQQPQQPAGKAISPSKTFTALPVMVNTRRSQANLLTRPMCLFGLFLGLENMGWLVAEPDRTFVVLYSSIWKPIVLYYISSQARHAMEALMRIARTVVRVLVIEMVLILSFAAVACRLFQDFDPFDHLSVAWLSLFKCEPHYCKYILDMDFNYFLTLLLPFANHSLRQSGNDGGQSKYLDAHVSEHPLVGSFLHIIYCCYRILHTFSGSLGCISNLYSSRR